MWSERRGDHSKPSAIELGRDCGLDLREQKDQLVWVHCQPCHWPGRSGPRSAGVQNWDKNKNWGGGRLEVKDLCDPEEIRSGGQGRLPWLFCCRAWIESRGLDLGRQREKSKINVIFF